jgi:hypothetical protein
MTTIGSLAADTRHSSEDEDYQHLLTLLLNALRLGNVPKDEPLFTTSMGVGLYDLFLGVLPAYRRAHYECRACRRFVDHFGGLVRIDEKGETTSLLWSMAIPPPFFSTSIRAVRTRVSRALVRGVFLSSEKVWGLPANASPKAEGGVWHHMHVEPGFDRIYRGSIHSADQAMAEKGQDFQTLSRALGEYPLELVEKAHALLTRGDLYRSESCIAVAEWLLALQNARKATADRTRRENLVWRAVATAPAGFCHVRTTMIGTLLDDLAANKSAADIKSAFDGKMNPAQYRRPQAAPTDGQIAAAERQMAMLASGGAFARRYALLEDVLPHALWRPGPPATAAADAGLFGHLKKAKAANAPLEVTAPQVLTWEKFARTVLPDAERIEVLTPSMPAPFFAFVTAVDPEAPPILQWDHTEKRNPVSWYFHLRGSPAHTFNLTPGAWTEVECVTLQPSCWTSDLTNRGEGAFFVLRGARDLRSADCGLGLLPEILKSEYHGMRAVLEAYSRTKTIAGATSATACGIALQKPGGGGGLRVRAHFRGMTQAYELDRWD